MNKHNLIPLIPLLLFCLQLDAQQCFDMTELTASPSVRLINRDVYLATVTETKEADGRTKKHYTYGWNNTVSPEDHPRQTLMTSPATDPLCPQLSVLPPDEKTSFRLASDGYLQPTDSAKGEQINYDYLVTSKRPLLVVKHAAVLQNPIHPIRDVYPRYGNPWCRVGVFLGDSLYERLSIDHCPALPETVKDFTVFTDTEGMQSLWLDWTTDTIDLSEFIGQTITIVLDCRDCALEQWTDSKKTTFDFCDAHHRGRMYAHLSCAPLHTYTCEGTFTAPDTICADAEAFRLANHFSEGTILSYDLRFSDNALAQGFADRSFLPLNNDTASIVVPIPQKTGSYPRPDNYSLQLVLHTRCEIDTVIPIRFTLLYPSRVIYQRWNDVLSVANSTFNGGYDFSDIVWYKDGVEVQGYGEHGAWYNEPDGFVYDRIDIVSGDDVSSAGYSVALTRADDGIRICSCRFSPVRQEDKTVLDNHAISVASLPDGSRRISTAVSGEYRIYSYTGALIKADYIAADEPVFMHLQNLPCLVYFRSDDTGKTAVLRFK